MSEKAKTDKPTKARVNRYGFLGLWVGGQVIGWLLMFLAFASGLMNFLGPVLSESEWLFAPIMAIFVGVPTVLMQKLALYLGYGRKIKGWIRINLLAWSLGSFMLAAVLEAGIVGTGRFEMLIQVMSLMLLPTIAQAFLLSRYIQRIWLWLIATVAASTVFAAVSQPFMDGTFGIFASFGAYAVVTGLTLIWLFGMQANENQLKAEPDTSRLEDGAEDEAEPEGSEMQSEKEQAQ